MPADIQRTRNAPGASGVGALVGTTTALPTNNTLAFQQGFNNITGDQLNQIIYEVLAPRVPKLANKSAVFFAKIAPYADERMKLSPRGYRLAIEKQENVSQKHHVEGGTMSSGDNREFVSANIFYSRVSQGTRLTVDALTSLQAGQAVETLKDYMAEDIRDFMRYLNFSAYQDGRGTRGVASAAVVIPAGGSANVTFANNQRVKALQVTGQYDVFEPVSPFTKRNGALPLTLTSKTVATAEATFSNPNAAPVNVAAGDIFVKEGSFGLDIAGLPYLIDDSVGGEYFGIPRNIDEKFRAVVDNSGGALSVAKLLGTVQAYKFRKGADKWNPADFVLLMSPTQFQAYLNLGDVTVNSNISGIRYDALTASRQLDLGYDLVKASFTNIPIVEDDSCQNDTIWGINRMYIHRAEYFPLAPITPYTGQPLFPIPAFDNTGDGTLLDSSMYILKWCGNLFLTDVSAHFAIKGLSTTGLTVF